MRVEAPTFRRRPPGCAVIWPAAVLACLSAGCAGRGGPGPGQGPRSLAGYTVVIDGDFSDWADRPVIAAGGSFGGTTAGAMAIALGGLRAAHDASAVYFLLDLGRVVNLQAMPGFSVRLALDVDGDPQTGQLVDDVPGVDLLVVFSPVRGAGPALGVMLQVPGDTTWYDSYSAGLYHGPTHASSRFEIRLARHARVAADVPPTFEGRSVAGRVVAVDAAGRQLDATPAFQYPLDAGAAVASAPGAGAVRRAAGTDVRVMTWNVGDRGLLKAADPYHRMIAALDPDVVLMDELHPALDQAWLEHFVSGWPRGPWQVHVGAGGGRQRTAVLSRFPLGGAPGLQRVEYPDSISALFGLPVSRQMANDLSTALADGVPTVGAEVAVRGARVLVMPMDFFCCGSAEGPDDRGRVMTAAAIQAAARARIEAGGIDAVLLGGDLNLVGSRTPLERIIRGLDPDGTDLVPVVSYRLDGVSTTTWRAPGPFPPGKLDYLFVSGSRLEVLRSFAFDPADLSPAARRRLGVRTEDGEVTDHLPVVADIRLRQAPADAGGSRRQ